ncbi:hypothetical protein LTR49_024848 [Elasticomyces elasticus]|nr:hypothetical protein LTR49_024848 [Elasticomyces elasticus]
MTKALSDKLLAKGVNRLPTGWTGSWSQSNIAKLLGTDENAIREFIAALRSEGSIQAGDDSSRVFVSELAEREKIWDRLVVQPSWSGRFVNLTRPGPELNPILSDINEWITACKWQLWVRAQQQYYRPPASSQRRTRSPPTETIQQPRMSTSNWQAKFENVPQDLHPPAMSSRPGAMALEWSHTTFGVVLPGGRTLTFACRTIMETGGADGWQKDIKALSWDKLKLEMGREFGFPADGKLWWMKNKLWLSIEDDEDLQGALSFMRAGENAPFDQLLLFQERFYGNGEDGLPSRKKQKRG